MGSIAPTFRWNVLNYGRVLNNVRLEQARTLELIANYQNTILTAGQETQTAIRSFEKTREQAVDMARAVQAAKAASNLGLEQYRTGVVPFNTVFNLETTQVQQQDQLAVIRGATAVSLIDVYRAIGGGWELRLEAYSGSIDFDSPPKLERLPAPLPPEPIESAE